MSGEKAPLFMALLVSSFKPGLSPLSLYASDFETERLFMHARASLARSAAISLTQAECTACSWELKGPGGTYAVFRIAAGFAPSGVALSVPGDPNLEYALQRLLRNAHSPLERIVDGTYRLSPAYGAFVREVFCDCFHVDTGYEDARRCACVVAGVQKASFASKFCLFMILFFIPFMCLLWRILKEKF